LEQFAFLLHVALRRLYLHFREHHHIPSGKYLVDAPMLTCTVLTRPESHDVKRVKSVTLDRKLSSTARLPQRSTVIDSPRPRMADENGHVVPAAKEPVAPLIMTPSGSEHGGSQAPTVDVIRPPFARNNTSVRILSDPQETPGDQSLIPEAQEAGGLSPLMADRRSKEPDAITLNDIPLLAGGQRRSRFDGQPLVAELKPLEAMVIRHFALLHLQKTGLGHLVEPEDFMDMLEMRRGQWWNFKLFKNNAKKDQKRKGIFGVPIEVLVERTGSDSQQGISSNVLLRVPEFIEEITATMRQQGESRQPVVADPRHGCRGHFPQERQHQEARCHHRSSRHQLRFRRSVRGEPCPVGGAAEEVPSRDPRPASDVPAPQVMVCRCL
jgi:hypothetical protein